MTPPFIQREPSPHAVPINADIVAKLKAIAEKEQTTVRAVANEALAQWLGAR